MNNYPRLVDSLESLRSKSIAVVGNARVLTQQSELVDRHDVVIRFNELNHFESGSTGSRFTHWANNRDSMRPDWAVCLAKRNNAHVYLVTQSSNSKKAKLAADFYAKSGFEVWMQASAITSPLKGFRERTGFLLLCKLSQMGISCTVFGFSSYSESDLAGRHNSNTEFDLLKRMNHISLMPLDGEEPC